MLLLPLEISYGEDGKLQHGKLKPVFHSLLAPETQSISKLKLFVIIANDFQPLTIVVKSSAEFLNLYMAPKDGYWHS